MKNSKRCLVTGGAGFIGYHLACRLQSLGYDVTILDTKQEQGSAKIKYVQGSIREELLMRRLIDEHDCVFHLAALLGVKRTMEEPVPMIENNLLGTINIVKWAHEAGRKVVFASTSEVYGKGTPPFEEENDQTFGPTTKTRWSYAVAKLLEEYLCLGYGKKGLPMTIVRYFNVYGPRQKDGAYGGVVSRFIRAALRNEDITVYGDGSQTRSFIYVSDAVEATTMALQSAADQQIFNIGTDQEITIYELALKIKELVDSKSRIIKIPYEEVFPHGFDEIPRRVPDVEKLKKNLGFQPKISLEEGLKRTIEWFERGIDQSAREGFDHGGNARK